MKLGFRKVSRDFAMAFLSDVAPEKCFWVHNGHILHNIYELSNALLTMRPETFMHHANSEKNDFSNWIADVLGDNELARRVRNLKAGSDISGRIKERIMELERACRVA